LNSYKKEMLKAWIAAGLWLALIAIESTSYLSSANTSRVLYPIVHFLFGVDPIRFITWHHYVRKSGHFIGYFMLSFLLFRAWRKTLPSSSLWELRWAATAFFISALVGSLDEWHQTFIPTRTGLVSDAILDSAAALIAQILIFLWFSVGSSRRQREEVVPVGQ
jgi:VanZ family protein